MREWREAIRRAVTGAGLDPAAEAGVVEELEQHLEDRYAELRSAGVGEAEARRRVLEELSSGEELSGAVRRSIRPSGPDVPLGGTGRPGPLSGVFEDVRYAVRTFAKQPTFALAAILALGLGAGAATAVFSLLDAVVLRALPYEDAERLGMIWDTQAEEQLTHEPLSPVTVLDYRSAPGVFEDVAVWWRPEMNLADEAGDPMRVSTVEVSENLFDVLGVGAALGRTFERDSTLHGDASEVVIGDGLWRTRFGGRTDVIGSTVRLNGFPHTVIGVMPPRFAFPGRTQVWQRLRWDLAGHSRHAHFMEAVGRLEAGVTAESATRELERLTARLGSEYPQSNEGWSARVVPLRAELTGMFSPGLVALFGASGLLLLIACINVANLLMARAGSRMGEVAVRSALGASRRRLVRQFLLESLLLAGAGTAVGLLVATFAVRGFLAWSPIEVPRADGVSVNAAVLLFTAGVALVTTLVFGLVPALRASRADLQQVLREASRGGAAGRRAIRSRDVLVVAEVALAVLLLAGAGLLIRSVSALLDEETGVAVVEPVVVDLQLPESQYEWSEVARFYQDLLRSLRDDPAITSVGASNFLPLETGWRVPYEVPGGDTRATDRMAQYHTAEGGFFRTMGVRLVEGRWLDERDDAESPPVVLVNEALAEREWPGESAVGKRLVSGARGIGPLGRRLTEDAVHEVVGVVADVKNTSLTAEAEPAVYTSVGQFPFFRMNIVLDGLAGPGALAARLREHVSRLDPGLPLGEVRSLERVLLRPTDASRFLMLLMTTFAALALVLAAIGIYGILSFSVAQRRREIGVRVALGARPKDVLGRVLRHGLVLGLVGAAVGVALSVVGARFIGSLLYGVRPVDAPTLAAVVLTVLAISALSCLAPALRAVAVDPVSTLKGE